jgi:hypothetical protein
MTAGEGITQGELGVVYEINLKVILSMVREPHHDKMFISKIKIQKSLNQKSFLCFKCAIQCGGFLGEWRKWLDQQLHKILK